MYAHVHCRIGELRENIRHHTRCVCRAMGMQSLPVAFGVDTAKWICAASIDVTQLAVAAYLFAGLHENIYAAVLLALVLPQVNISRSSACIFHYFLELLGALHCRVLQTDFRCRLCAADLLPDKVFPSRPHQERREVSGISPTVPGVWAAYHRLGGRPSHAVSSAVNSIAAWIGSH